MTPCGTSPHLLFNPLPNIPVGLPCAESLVLLLVNLKTDPGEHHKRWWCQAADVLLLPGEVCVFTQPTWRQYLTPELGSDGTFSPL